VADKYDLRKYVKFRNRISSAIWDEQSDIWNTRINNVETGEQFEDWFLFFINASGFLK
jgi:hypothetical protein